MNKDLRFYQAIETKFVGPTNSHGGKIKAEAFGTYILRHRDHSLNTEQDHYNVAFELLQKHGNDKWADLVGGTTKNGYVFVLVPKPKQETWNGDMVFCDTCKVLGLPSEMKLCNKHKGNERLDCRCKK